MSKLLWTAPNGEVLTADPDTQTVYVWAREDLIGAPDGLIVGPWEFDEGCVPTCIEDAGELYRSWASHGRPGDMRREGWRR